MLNRGVAIAGALEGEIQETSSLTTIGIYNRTHSQSSSHSYAFPFARTSYHRWPCSLLVLILALPTQRSGQSQNFQRFPVDIANNRESSDVSKMEGLTNRKERQRQGHTAIETGNKCRHRFVCSSRLSHGHRRWINK